MRELPEVLIIYNLPDTTDNRWIVSTFGAESGEGVVEEVKVVTAALDKSGTPYRVIGVRRLSDVPMVLASAREQVIWNLVEGLIGDAQDTSHIPALCCAYGKMSTGCDSPCLSLTLDKWRTKAVLREAGIPAPTGIIVTAGASLSGEGLGMGPFIVKPAESDASEGINSSSVFGEYCPQMEETVRVIHRNLNQPVLIEQYIDGREFNVSVIQDGNDIRVMPIAEIDFSAFVPGKARIVDYAAKWLPDSFEYKNTPRVIPANISEDVADRIKVVAVKAWHALGCQDFIRVDMRMDAKGGIYVLEVNANPDISLDAGFAAALSAGSVPGDEFVRMVVSNAVERLHQQKALQRHPVPGDIVHGSFSVRRTRLEDRDQIIAITENTGYFRPDEIAIACEVLDDALTKGSEGHYQSFTAESDGKIAGWVCFGPTPCTLGTFDVYWIVVAPGCQRRGIGSALMRHAEEIISSRDGRLSVIETSGKGLYDSTRGFYNKMGYSEQARIAEFYAAGDDKIIYTKLLS
jgi:D-alanine-D-alanine ligase